MVQFSSNLQTVRACFDSVCRVCDTTWIKPETRRISVGVEEWVKVEVLQDLGILQSAEVEVEIWWLEIKELAQSLTSGWGKHTSGMLRSLKFVTLGSGCCTIVGAGAEVGCCWVAVVALTPFLKELGCWGVMGVDGVGVGGGSASDEGVAAVLALAAAAPFFVMR